MRLFQSNHSVATYSACLVGMISILRGSFDIILPCVLDAAGRCKLPPQMSGDMEKLEKMLGCRVAGANLRDLLAGEDPWQPTK